MAKDIIKTAISLKSTNDSEEFGLLDYNRPCDESRPQIKAIKAYLTETEGRGFIAPIVVAYDKKTKKFVILDGQHRALAIYLWNKEGEAIGREIFRPFDYLLVDLDEVGQTPAEIILALNTGAIPFSIPGRLNLVFKDPNTPKDYLKHIVRIMEAVDYCDHILGTEKSRHVSTQLAFLFGLNKGSKTIAESLVKYKLTCSEEDVIRAKKLIDFADFIRITFRLKRIGSDFAAGLYNIDKDHSNDPLDYQGIMDWIKYLDSLRYEKDPKKKALFNSVFFDLEKKFNEPQTYSGCKIYLNELVDTYKKYH